MKSSSHAILSVTGRPVTSATRVDQIFLGWGFSPPRGKSEEFFSSGPLWAEIKKISESSSAGTFTINSGYSDVKILHEGRIVSSKASQHALKILGKSEKFNQIEISLQPTPLEDNLVVAPDQLPEPQFIERSRMRPQMGQPRIFFKQEDLQELANSLRRHGQIYPILVRKLKKDEIGPDGLEFEILDGERRWRASALAGRKDMKCFVTDKHYDNLQAFIESFIANHQAKAHTVFENILAVRRMSEKLSAIEIAQRVGMNRFTVHLYQSLDNLAPDLFDLMHPEQPEEVQMRLSWALELAKLGDHQVQRDKYAKIRATVTRTSQVTKALKAEISGHAHHIQKGFNHPTKRIGSAIPNIIQSIHTVTRGRDYIATYFGKLTTDHRQKIITDLRSVHSELEEILKTMDALFPTP